jgi:hypothetical protein
MSPRRGLDTKTARLTDRQLQSDLDLASQGLCKDGLAYKRPAYSKWKTVDGDNAGVNVVYRKKKDCRPLQGWVFSYPPAPPKARDKQMNAIISFPSSCPCKL